MSQVAACRIDQIGGSRKRFAGDARKSLAIRRALPQPFTDLIRQRATKVGMGENG